MTDIQIFNNPDFGDIRTVEIDGEAWFVGKDVACALGYAKPLGAVSTHVEKDDSLKRGLMDSLGREQETIFINESGLYALIFGSKLDSAKKFKKWVTSEDPKSHRESFRLSDDDMMKLNYCMEKTGMNKTEVIRKGIDMVYNELKKE